MRFRTVILLLLALISLHAGKLISPDEAITRTYGKDVMIAKRAIQLSDRELQAVSDEARTALKAKKFQVFKISNGKKIVAFAVLISQKVRTKSAAVLYMIDVNGMIRSVEIVAFNEPGEFIPSPGWLTAFKQKSSADPLHLDKDIPNITGATMSARIITEGSRVALALFDTILKK